MVEEGMVYCGSCGGELSASARFCRACGAPQEEFAPREADAHPPPAPAPEPALAPPVATAPQPQLNSLIGQSVAAPLPVAPSVGLAQRSRSSALTTAALLAILGGVGMCFM